MSPVLPDDDQAVGSSSAQLEAQIAWERSMQQDTVFLKAISLRNELVGRLAQKAHNLLPTLISYVGNVQSTSAVSLICKSSYTERLFASETTDTSLSYQSDTSCVSHT